jgi:hypothetical protein
VSGDTLTCSVTSAASDADGDALTYAFAWDDGGVDYAGATSSTTTSSTVPGGAVGGGPAGRIGVEQGGDQRAQVRRPGGDRPCAHHCCHRRLTRVGETL